MAYIDMYAVFLVNTLGSIFQMGLPIPDAHLVFDFKLVFFLFI